MIINETKTYCYKGISFHKTDVICANNGRNLYRIEGVKEEGKRPFLTSIADCRWYIENHCNR